jgi:hypothetical protein
MIQTAQKLPVSFNKYIVARPTLKRMMILIQGSQNTGKTEFIMSAPGPGLNFCLDMGYEGVENNEDPPKTRNSSIINFPFSVKPTMSIVGSDDAGTAKIFAEEWNAFEMAYMETIKNEDSLTSGLDGGTEQWETLRMALWGRLEQIIQLNYPAAYKLLRAFVWRQFNSHKNIIQTFKMKDEWVDDLDAFGNVQLDDKGRKKRKASGGKEMDGPHGGFSEYCWQVQMQSMYRDGSPAKTILNKITKKTVTIPAKPGEFGMRILECKFKKSLKDYELWGDECNFQGLARLIFPNTPLSDWGY